MSFKLEPTDFLQFKLILNGLREITQFSKKEINKMIEDINFMLKKYGCDLNDLKIILENEINERSQLERAKLRVKTWKRN
ncbi:MAG: hypothetical protein J0H68_09680 [Sphingobacteriia bacterium]|nr:hypothetical protein [Sphingobacteriia bacterium]